MSQYAFGWLSRNLFLETHTHTHTHTHTYIYIYMCVCVLTKFIVRWTMMIVCDKVAVGICWAYIHIYIYICVCVCVCVCCVCVCLYICIYINIEKMGKILCYVDTKYGKAKYSEVMFFYIPLFGFFVFCYTIFRSINSRY